jgi:hypothetical protein
MTLSASAYGTVAQVAAYVRHLTTNGTFDAASRPTAAQVEQFIEQRSAILNGCLAEAGYTVPVGASYTQARTVLAYYAVQGAAADCELTQRSSGTEDDKDNPRWRVFLKEFEKGCPFIASGAFAALGAPATGGSPAIAGLWVGGRTRGGQKLRPVFGRTSFQNDPTIESPTVEPDYTEE